MAFQVQENAVFIHEISKIFLPCMGKPPSSHPARSLRSHALPPPPPPLTNPGCTTVTGIAKGTRAHALRPLDWSKIIFLKGE